MEKQVNPPACVTLSSGVWPAAKAAALSASAMLTARNKIRPRRTDNPLLESKDASSGPSAGGAGVQKS
jgi:hypothetical protein